MSIYKVTFEVEKTITYIYPQNETSVLVNITTCSYRAPSVYVRPFQRDGDAVEEDEDQNHMVKQFVRDCSLAPHTESKYRHRESSVTRACSVKAIVTILLLKSSI